MIQSDSSLSTLQVKKDQVVVKLYKKEPTSWAVALSDTGLETEDSSESEDAGPGDN